MFGMTAKRNAAAGAAFFGLGLVLLLAWGVHPRPSASTGGLSVAFVGLTNDASGAELAQFNVSNRCTRRVELGVNEAQIRQATGWPDCATNLGGSNWFSLPAGTNLLFSVPAPSIEGAAWRVSLDYCEDRPFHEEVFETGKGMVGYAIFKLTGHPSCGIRGGSWSEIYGPEMLTLSNQPHAVAPNPNAEPGAPPNAAPPHRSAFR